MLKNIRLANLVVENQNHTDLSITDFFIKNVKIAINQKAKSIRESFNEGKRNEGFVVFRLNENVSIVIACFKKYKENPQFFAYNMKTKEPALSISYENFKSLLEDGILEQFSKRMDFIGEKDMSRMLKLGTIQKMDELVASVPKRGTEYHYNFDEKEEQSDATFERREKEEERSDATFEQSEKEEMEDALEM